MVFPKVNCPGDCSEGGQHVQGCGGIFPSAGTSNDAGDCRVGGRNGEASVNMDGFIDSG